MVKNKRVERNWPLVVFASMLIVLGLAFIAISVVYARQLGWWGLATGLTGLALAASLVTSIAKNDPSWILMDILLS